MKHLPIWITTLPKLEPYDQYYNDLYKQGTEKINTWVGNNFPISDPDKTWDSLYQRFLDKTQEILGRLTLLPDNSRTCWLYMMNKDFYRDGIHHHMNTSVINAVYYFSVPESKEYRDSAIAFYNDDDTEFWHYKPREGDLVFFPNYLKHQPLPTTSEKYRFAINMEIKCEWPAAFGRRP